MFIYHSHLNMLIRNDSDLIVLINFRAALPPLPPGTIICSDLLMVDWHTGPAAPPPVRPPGNRSVACTDLRDGVDHSDQCANQPSVADRTGRQPGSAWVKIKGK